MRETEPEQSQNNFDVEITDLESGREPIISPPRFWAGQRKRPLILVSLTLAAVALLLLTSTGSFHVLLDDLSTSPNPAVAPAPASTPTLFPGENLFYVQADPPWGRLFIDGRVIARLPIPKIDPPLKLSIGRHTLTWQADPFYDQQCTLSVPPKYAIDTCLSNSTIATQNGDLTTLVTFAESLNTLMPGIGNALKAAVQAALDARLSSAIVQPGEAYALAPANPACKPGQGEPACYAIATQPLRAALHLRLDTNPSSNEFCNNDPETNCTHSYASCYSFCSTQDSPASATSSNGWDVFAPVFSLWTFATQSGKILEQNVPDNSLWDYWNGATSDESLLRMRITWDAVHAQWHVTLSNPGSQQLGLLGLTCAAAGDSTQFLQPPANAKGEPLDIQWQFVAGATPADGCLAIGSASPQQYFDVTPADVPLSYFLFRFGVLLAANDTAHSFWPYVPVADTQERQWVQDLATQHNLPG
jgi:hypothetical protein